MRWLFPVLATAALLSCDERGKQGESVVTGNEDEWAVSRQCAVCHQKEYAEWLASDHAWAARPAQAAPGEAFAGQTLTAHGQTLRAERDAQGNRLFRDIESGKAWPVKQLIGRKPLLQFAVEGERGAWQVPSLAWDAAKKEWYDVFAEDERMQAEGTSERRKGDWGHWQGRGMAWNSQCAWCHMSGYRKNYQPETDSFQSKATEPGVTCVACHKVSVAPAADGCLVAPADRVLSREQNEAVCAACHARREELDGRFEPGADFENHFRLELPRVAGVFYPNGAQREEDYCETSFRLSRMGATGVTCYDCHNPHSGAVIAPIENNALCLRCHATHRVINGREAPYVDPRETFLCPRTSKGHLCVECHMPESRYMGRDARRDHSLMPPDPQLSRETGMPNTCLNCHADRGQAWTEKVWAAHYGEHPAWSEQYRPRTRAVAAELKGQGKNEDLLAAYDRETIPAWRATLLGLMQPTPAAVERAAAAAHDKSPMVRAAAAELLGEQALPLLGDAIRSVRTVAGWQLFPAALRDPRAAEELLQTARFQADQPTGAMQLAMLYRAAGQGRSAEQQYRRAVELDPSGAVARMDYAVFLAQQNRPAEALQQMLACTAAHPELAEAQYRLGLILAETGQLKAAAAALKKALELDPHHTRAAEALRGLNAPLRTLWNG